MQSQPLSICGHRRSGRATYRQKWCLLTFALLFTLVRLSGAKLAGIPTIGRWKFEDGIPVGSEGLVCRNVVEFRGDPGFVNTALYDGLTCKASPPVPIRLNNRPLDLFTNYITEFVSRRSLDYLHVDGSEDLPYFHCALNGTSMPVTSASAIFTVDGDFSINETGLEEYLVSLNRSDLTFPQYSFDFRFEGGKTYLFVRNDCIYSFAGGDKQSFPVGAVVGGVGALVVVIVAVVALVYFLVRRTGAKPSSAPTTTEDPFQSLPVKMPDLA